MSTESLQAALLGILSRLSALIWGPYGLIPLLLLTGLYLTVRLGGLQFRELGPALYLALVVRRDEGARGDVSHFQALMTALAATVGTGNIVGVATAIAMGGPGALFWMWMTGLVGMATKYSEALLSVHYRVTRARGEQAGGPMYYLARGLRPARLGRALGALFATCAAFASFGIGNMAQSHSVADALAQSLALDPRWSGAAIALVAGLVLLGGIRWIGRFSSAFVPAMIVAYVAGSLVALVRLWARLPGALMLVLRGAASGAAARGGFAGASLAQAIRYGVARGIFSNESGLGSAGIVAAAAQTEEPKRQALVSMTQTFIDTIVVCSLTGLVIVASGAWQSGEDGAPLTQHAFRVGLPGEWGHWVVALALACFAFSTIIGWSYYGERCVEYLFGSRAIVPYRLLFVLAVYGGATLSLQLVWTFADVMNGLMALPNLVGLLVLSGELVKLSARVEASR